MRLLAAGALLFAASAALAAPSGYDWKLPKGVSPPPVPTDNVMSAAKVELGRRLFYDADLSRDGTTSCATCHEQHRAFAEGNRSHPGVGGVPGRRNVMGLSNVGYFSPLTWADSSQRKLEDQMLVPLMGDHPVEMGMAGMDAELVRRLNEDPCYPQMFKAAFPGSGGKIDRDAITKAVASFERTLISRNAPYDRYLKGDTAALSAAALRGKSLFDSDCAGCHAGTNFTDLKYHVIGLHAAASKEAARDHGLKEITGEAKDEGAIRTPSLRNVAYTGPYMHDGSAANLVDAIRGHLSGRAQDAKLAHLKLSPAQVQDLVSFLQSLSDQGFVTNPAFALPKTACGKPL